MPLRDAIETYHDLLTDELASATQAQLDDQQFRRGLFFGHRPLCTVLRPRFITPEQYRFLQSRVRILLHAFDKAYYAAIADADFRAQFGLLDWEEKLVQHAPGFRASSPTSRVDTFFVTERGGLRLTEYNAETPASPAYSDVLTEIFYCLPVTASCMPWWTPTSNGPAAAKRRASQFSTGVKCPATANSGCLPNISNCRAWSASLPIHARSSIAMASSLPVISTLR